MARGKVLSLKEARKAGKITQFCKEHPSTGDLEKFDRLFEAMARGGPPRKKARGGKTLPRADDAC
jgi:hypothetical protein